MTATKVTLIARHRLKFGSLAGPRGPLGLTIEQRGRSVEPGEEFEVGDELATRFLAEESAMTRATALDEARAISARGEMVPDLYRVVAAEAHVAVTPAERLNAAIDEARRAGLSVTVEVRR